MPDKIETIVIEIARKQSVLRVSKVFDCLLSNTFLKPEQIRVAFNRCVCAGLIL